MRNNGKGLGLTGLALTAMLSGQAAGSDEALAPSPEVAPGATEAAPVDGVVAGEAEAPASYDLEASLSLDLVQDVPVDVLEEVISGEQAVPAPASSLAAGVLPTEGTGQAEEVVPEAASPGTETSGEPVPEGEAAKAAGVSSPDSTPGSEVSSPAQEAGLSVGAPAGASAVAAPKTDLERKVDALASELEQMKAEERARRERSFVKGPLAGVGDIDFVYRKHHISASLRMFPIEEPMGGTVTNRTYYLGAVPEVDLHFGRLYLGLELPLAFQIFNTQVDSTNPDYLGGDGFDNAGTFAGFQWDEASEFAQVLKYLRFGTKEDDLYLNVSKSAAASVGHGTIVRRYNPNIDLDHFHVSAQLDKSFKYGGVELYTNDIVKYGVGGLLGYVKPGAFFMPDNLYVRSASLGISYLYDRLAPYSLVRDPANASHLVANDQFVPQVDESQMVSLLGVDTEVKLVKRPQLDVKGYIDYSRLMNTGGDGFSLGSLVRINLGGDKDDSRVHAFRIRTEVGAYHARYAPGYFDMFYELQKYQMEVADSGEVVPKLRYLESQTGGYRPGARVEATYSIVDGLGMSAAYQTSAGGRDSQVLLHVEVPGGEHLRFLATYVRTNLSQKGNWFSLDDPNTLLIARAKLRLLPILFVNGEVSKMYRLKGVAENEALVTELDTGTPAEFKNVLRWVLETEIGFEF